MQNIEETISGSLQQGINPYRSNMSSYCFLAVRKISEERYSLRPFEMKGPEVHYKYLEQIVGPQTLVSTIKTLGAKHRIHKDNFKYYDLQQSED